MSYDLNITGRGELDLDLAYVILGADPRLDADPNYDEVDWLRDALTAQFLLTPEEIDVGIVSDEAPQADRARDFEDLLRFVLDLAHRLDADVYDPQLGRNLGPDDIAEAVRGFAGPPRGG